MKFEIKQHVINFFSFKLTFCNVKCVQLIFSVLWTLTSWKRLCSKCGRNVWMTWNKSRILSWAFRIGPKQACATHLNTWRLVFVLDKKLNQYMKIGVSYIAFFISWTLSRDTYFFLSDASPIIFTPSDLENSSELKILALKKFIM